MLDKAETVLSQSLGPNLAYETQADGFCETLDVREAAALAGVKIWRETDQRIIWSRYSLYKDSPCLCTTLPFPLSQAKTP